MKPRLLDLFCGAGGAALGYARAGFEVVGVDHVVQPNYPFEFMRWDALERLRSLIQSGNDGYNRFDAIHTSPPCQAHSKVAAMHPHREYPDLIAPTRALLIETGLPWVIENVKGAPLAGAQILEGQMFGLALHRPRLFETNWGYEAPLLRPPPPRQAKLGHTPKTGEVIQVVGHMSPVSVAKKAMGIDWMTQEELAEAIPPAYTEHIGGYLFAHLEAQERVAA